METGFSAVGSLFPDSLSGRLFPDYKFNYHLNLQEIIWQSVKQLFL